MADTLAVLFENGETNIGATTTAWTTTIIGLSAQDNRPRASVIGVRYEESGSSVSLEEICNELDRGIKEMSYPVSPNLMEFSWDRILVAYLAEVKDRGDREIISMEYLTRRLNDRLILRFDVLAGKVNALVQSHGRRPHDD